MEGLLNIGIILTYIMIGFAALTAVSFGVKKILSNTKNAKKTLRFSVLLAPLGLPTSKEN